eukprot:scaffold5760_cov57-Phaeocystis_antarctica.AAC.4
MGIKPYAGNIMAPFDAHFHMFVKEHSTDGSDVVWVMSGKAARRVRRGCHLPCGFALKGRP